MHKAATINAVEINLPADRESWTSRLFKDLRRYRIVYLMAIPVLAYYIIFCYVPMYGAVIAFENFNPVDGFLSPWVGFRHFIEFFQSYYFLILIRNTFLISFFTLIFGFPMPIILALLLNELRGNAFKRTVQTISYLPHFISLVVVCGLIVDFTSSTGLITRVLHLLTGYPLQNMLQEPRFFIPIYVISNIWQTVGWGSIIYLAALAGIDQEQFEAARIDGASRFQQMWHITLPGIMPTIVVLLILQIGQMMNVGYEKILLLYTPVTYDVADVISTFVYRRGILSADYSFATAVGLFNSGINFALLVSANWISRKVNETSLW